MAVFPSCKSLRGLWFWGSWGLGFVASSRLPGAGDLGNNVAVAGTKAMTKVGYLIFFAVLAASVDGISDKLREFAAIPLDA